MSLRLLLVEDDAALCAEVARAMRDSGHRLDVETGLAVAFERARAETYDVIIADRMLPAGDGLELVGRLRAEGNSTPVLILTALGSVADRVLGLKSGADDYLVKPFSMDELEARVEALARRALAKPVRIVIGTLVLDRLARKVHRGDRPITLMPREYQLLELLMVSSPAIVTRSMLLEQIWGVRFDPGTNLIESHVSRLRTKIDRGGDPQIIHTVRGEGYVAREG